MSEIDNFYCSRTTLGRLEDSFDGAYLELCNLIADNFLRGDNLTGEDIWYEFVMKPRLEKEAQQKIILEEKRKKEAEIKKYRALVREKASPYKCQAIIHLKKELRQCQNKPLPDEDLCSHHERLEVLPYGRVELDDD